MREIELPGADSGLGRIGPYELLQTLGRGGMGQVYRARHGETGQTVAIKVLAAELVEDAEAIARFQREAKVISSIRHPNVARVLDHGLSEGGARYIVMEFINGPSLADLIRNRTDSPFSVIARRMTEASLGLQAAYKEKIVHRDVKPANMMVGENGGLKIVDFGLAKNLFENTFRTVAGAVLGTPRYMAPEQGRGQSIDHRSDMYSLGASFYHLVAGQPPFEADTTLALMMKHIQTPLTPLYVINPLTPADLGDVIHRLMAKDPGDRYQDYDDLIAHLRQVELARRAKEQANASRGPAGFLDETPKTVLLTNLSQTTPAPRGVPPAAPSPGGGEAAPALSPLFEPAKSSFGGWLVGALVVLIVGLALAALATRERTETNGRKRSGLASFVAGFLVMNKEKASHEADAQRLNNLELTRTRMRVLYNMCLIHAARTGEFPRRVDDLVEAGIARAGDIVDAWNTKLAIYPVRRELVSFGEDRVEHSQDDYRLGPDDRFLCLPAALQDIDLRKSLDVNRP